MELGSSEPATLPAPAGSGPVSSSANCLVLPARRLDGAAVAMQWYQSASAAPHGLVAGGILGPRTLGPAPHHRPVPRASFFRYGSAKPSRIQPVGTRNDGARMRSKGLRGLLFVVVSLIVLVAVGALAYNVGMNAAGNGDRTFFDPMMRGYHGGYLGLGAGWFLWGIVPAILIGLGIVWLVVALSGGSGRSAPTTPVGPAEGVDRLRELSEMHDRGALSDDEFAAAKRRMLGLS